MENTTEEKKQKLRLFCQYYGQKVSLSVNEDQSYGMLSYIEWDLIQQLSLHSNEVLLLTSIADITDEHAIEVAKIIGYDDRPLFSQVEEVKEWLNDRFGIGHIKHKWDCLKAFDFLRKNSYAIPFDGISVEELIKLGWVKIRK